MIERLRGIQQQLMGAYLASNPMSSSSKGAARETLVDKFLRQCLPPTYRFGNGDVIDQEGNHSGQIDVVIEHPLGPSLPAVGNEQIRLYLAETVAAAIEVKSDIAGQWNEILKTSSALSSVKRKPELIGMTLGGEMTPRIPLVAVGYTGWVKASTARDKLREHENVDAILVIENGIFATSDSFGGLEIQGDASLWLAISLLHFIASQIIYMPMRPARYVTTPENVKALAPEVTFGMSLYE